MEIQNINENEWLKRKYFKNDNAFYAHKISISCLEQAKYQSLRKCEMDYFLVFADDINIKVYMKPGAIKINTHNLEFNSSLCKYCCVTEKYKEAEKSIEQILSMGNVVVFRTAMDYLHSYAWYHMNEPYTRIHHYSVIIGSDSEDYFYVDVPGTRNTKYFRTHSENHEVGKINKKELLQAFQYYCEIGYIEVNEQYIKDIANINIILWGIVQSYYSLSQDNVSYEGKQALEKLVCILRNKSNMDEFFLDEFKFALFASRHRLLIINIQKYKSCISQHNLKKCIELLEEIAAKWEIIRNLVIKNGIVKNVNIGEHIAEIIEKSIIPCSDELMYYLRISVKHII